MEAFVDRDGVASTDERAISERCSLPAVRGGCYEAEIRWFYNIRIGKCDTFLFSGCAGNENNFPSVEDCQLACEAGDMGKTAQRHSQRTPGSPYTASIAVS